MKKVLIFIILLLFASNLLHSQTLYLKKIITQLEGYSESISYYNYDENWHLQSIYRVSLEDTVVTKLFENDRIIMEIQPNMSMQYIYAGDTVYEYYQHFNYGLFILNYISLINDDFQMTDLIPVDENGNGIPSLSNTYQWEFGNCTEAQIANIGQESCTYNMNIKNPYFNENKFYRRSFPGSVNQINIFDGVEIDEEYTVLNSEYGYPTEVLFQSTYNNFEGTILYEYHEPSGINDVLQLTDADVLDIKYYNLLGEQIHKPSHGFYIEQVITSKGSFSKKHYKNKP